MASPLDIANQALAHLGASYQIADLDAEASQEASVCRLFIWDAIKQPLEDFAWPIATRFIVPALVTPCPSSEWTYAYRAPSDCLVPRKFLSGIRNPGYGQETPFRVVSDLQGKLILTDAKDQTLEYTALITDINLFPSGLKLAASLYLAYLIAPTLTKGDPYKLMERALQRYDITIKKAEAVAANGEQSEPEPESEFIRGRM